VILGFDKTDNVVRIKILKATEAGVMPTSIEYAYGTA
jgi:hypothetical protein